MSKAKYLFFLFFCLFAKSFLFADSNSVKITTSQTITLGAIQGITEFLPVSSTGHMILANEKIFSVSQNENTRKKAIDSYMVCIQLGTILTLLLFYRKQICRIFWGCLGKDRIGFKLGFNVGIAFIPAGLIGFLLDGFIQAYFYNSLWISIALIAGGFVILNLKKINRNRCACKDIYDLSLRSAWVIGLFQVIALWPGFSRSLATILGGIWIGFSLIQAVHFSFLLGLLTSTVATLYKFLKHSDVLLQYIDGTSAWLGIGIAFILGMLTIKIFFKFLQKHDLTMFGYYRIFIGIILLLCLK